MSITVPYGRAEVARARMIDLFPEGFEEIEHGDGVELVAYTDSGGEHDPLAEGVDQPPGERRAGEPHQRESADHEGQLELQNAPFALNEKQTHHENNK